MRPALVSVSALACLLWTSGCDPSLTFEAKAGCGEASNEESRHGPEMLPGRECKSCHRGYTASGTVFDTRDAACNTGVAGVTVEILDMPGNTQISLTTNAVGNFYTKAKLPTPFRARITAPDGRSQEMLGAMGDGNCSRCHRQPPVEDAKGRLALDVPPSTPDAGSGAAAGSAG
jgi:hypothetical protein